MTDLRHIEMIGAEYRKAKTKHPFFAHKMTCETGEESAMVALWRDDLEQQIKGGSVSADTVLQCEIAEAFEAYSQGDYDAALVELAQCGAVILRMMEMVDDNQNKCTVDGAEYEAVKDEEEETEGDALKAAMALLELTGWQPMETAPRDGTKVLLRESCFLRYVGCYAIGDCTNDEWWWAYIPAHPECPHELTKIKPTGWLPLPKIEEVEE